MSIEFNASLLNYTPVDENARQKIEAGNFGQIQNVTMEDKVLSVTTDLGIFKFKGPELDQPGAMKTSAYVDAGESLGSISMEKSLVDIMDIMRLFHQVAMQQRQTGREVRHSQRDMAIQSIHDQAEKVRDAALRALIGGVISGVCTMAAGAMTAFGGIKGLKNPGQSEALAAKYSGIGKIFEGAGQAGSAGFQWWAEQARAEQKELEADQKVHETHAQDETEWMQNMLDVIRDTRQKIEEVIRAQQDTMKSIVRA